MLTEFADADNSIGADTRLRIHHGLAYILGQLIVIDLVA